MENRVPLPTDNIYKFYALFGLLLFIFSIGATLVNHKSTNDYLYRNLLELEAVKAIEAPTSQDAVKRQLIEKLIEVAKSDKEFATQALGILAAVGFWVMAYGFHRWHRKVQPKHDKLLDLQIEKLERELDLVDASPNSAR